MRSAVLANARSRICFQLPAEDARIIARGDDLLEPMDMQGLGRFEAYAKLLADGFVQTWCSLRTDPPPLSTSDPAEVRARSRERYGISRTETESELEALVVQRRRASGDDLVPRRRSGGQR